MHLLAIGLVIRLVFFDKTYNLTVDAGLFAVTFQKDDSGNWGFVISVEAKGIGIGTSINTSQTRPLDEPML